MKTLMESDVMLTMEHMLNDMTEDRAEALGKKHLPPKQENEEVVGSVADSALIKRMFGAYEFADHRADELRAISENEIDETRADELLIEAARLDNHGSLMRGVMYLQIMHELNLWGKNKHINLSTNWDVIECKHNHQSPGEIFVQRLMGGPQ